jgi:hypothetical protein
MNWNSWTLGGVGRIGKMAELEEKRDKDVSSAFKVNNCALVLEISFAFNL